MELEEGPGEIYSDIGGLEAQVQELKEAVELPLTKPHLFEQVGIRPPKGVLLYGPPGTGKTLLARAVAHETNAHFLRVVGSGRVQKYIGVPERTGAGNLETTKGGDACKVSNVKGPSSDS